MSDYKLKIRTMSPVHIGDGSFYDGMTSFEYNNRFFPLDSNSLLSSLRINKIPPNDFIKWIADAKQERETRKPRIGDFIRFNFPQKAEDIIEELAKFSKLEIDNISLKNINTDISTCLKDINNKPYIPGSEIKGAIVTTLLYDLLKKDKEFIKKLRNKLNENYDFLTEVYESMKNIKYLTDRKKQLGFQNYQKIGISPSRQRDFRKILTMRERPMNDIRRELTNRMGIKGARLEEICDLIEEWRNGDKRTYINKIKSERYKYDDKRIKQLEKELHKLEDEYLNTYFAVSSDKEDSLQKLMRFIQISDSNTVEPAKITNCLIIHQNPLITMDLFFEIIHTNVVYESKFKIEKNDLALKALNFPVKNTGILDLGYITQCIHDFSAKVIEEDLKYLNNLKSYNYRFELNDLKAHLEELKTKNRPQSPLLRIGKGQGFFSLTMAMLIKELDPECYTKLIGVIQSNKNNPDNYPITRRIFADKSEKYKFPGWLKLNFEEVQS